MTGGHLVRPGGGAVLAVPRGWAAGASDYRRWDPVGEEAGAVHTGFGVCELGPGGQVPAHVHSFEESFFVVEGSGVVGDDGGPGRQEAPGDEGPEQDHAGGHPRAGVPAGDERAVHGPADQLLGLGADRRAGLLGDLAGLRVMVTGAGPIGLLVLAAARHAGARDVIVTDLTDAALDALTRERLQEDLRTVSAGADGAEARTSVFVTHSAEEAVFLGSRIVVLTRGPGRIALDLTVDLPRSGVPADELRGSAEYAALRAEVGRAVKLAAAA